MRTHERPECCDRRQCPAERERQCCEPRCVHPLTPFEKWLVERHLDVRFPQIESECGLAVYRLKRVHREAIRKLLNAHACCEPVSPGC